MIIEIELKTVALTLLTVFLIAMAVLGSVFIKALFKFPTLRSKLWHGITNGDMEPSLDDFQRTSQLFWAYIFGTVLACTFFLVMAFPNSEWHFIVISIGSAFLACIGLRKFFKS